MQTCNRCKHAFYCSAACQKACWTAHKLHCGTIKQRIDQDSEAAGAFYLRRYLPTVMRVRPHAHAVLALGTVARRIIMFRKPLRNVSNLNRTVQIRAVRACTAPVCLGLRGSLPRFPSCQTFPVLQFFVSVCEHTFRQCLSPVPHLLLKKKTTHAAGQAAALPLLARWPRVCTV